MNLIKKGLLGIFLCLISSALFSWNAAGHCVVATIAYDQLTDAAKSRVNELIQALPAEPGMPNDFCAAANWPDYIRGQQINAFTNWHFIDQRLMLEGKPKRQKSVPKPNIIWAINQSNIVLASPNAQDYQKAWFFRFLSHLVGDIHQPLHTASLFNQQFPHGDRGGNLYKITSPLATNLHSLWDQGVGLVPNGMNQTQIKQLAKQLEQTYPPGYFGASVGEHDPNVWASEGFRINKTYVYQVPYLAKPSKAYIEQGQTIAAQRLTLAGYRLAYVLNLWASYTEG